jgi:hypothetical protein
VHVRLRGGSARAGAEKCPFRNLPQNPASIGYLHPSSRPSPLSLTSWGNFPLRVALPTSTPAPARPPPPSRIPSTWAPPPPPHPEGKEGAAAVEPFPKASPWRRPPGFQVRVTYLPVCLSPHSSDDPALTPTRRLHSPNPPAAAMKHYKSKS